jgi:hypothetical protein
MGHIVNVDTEIRSPLTATADPALVAINLQLEIANSLLTPCFSI